MLDSVFRAAVLSIVLATAAGAAAATRIRIMPADGGTLAAGQRFDVRVEATSDTGGPPSGLVVRLRGVDVTARNVAGASEKAPPGATNFLLRGVVADVPGTLEITARTADGASATARLTVAGWNGRGRAPRARNVILLLGDGMGMAHRTAARIVSRGVRNGRAQGRLAMDQLDVTGVVMTSSLNALITDSSPGMAAYTTGQKSNNNQQGVFPDNTPDPFDNPRIEYLGQLLRRVRGPGFNVGIVTTADVTDSTPAANAVHTADRYAAAAIAARFFDERQTNAVTVLLGGGARHFAPAADGGARTDGRNLQEEFRAAGYLQLATRQDVETQLKGGNVPERLLGLFDPSHMPVAFDKVGTGRYSDELAVAAQGARRDPPMLEDMTRLALASLSRHSPAGFYLMVEGASIDKRAHAADAERVIWDVIEFDRAVDAAMQFARRTNGDADPTNDTLVIVTADHECGGMAIVGVGNERYAPAALGSAVRDYAAVFRFGAEQQLELFPNYVVDDRGYPVDPDPSRKLLIGWAAAPDRYENWLANRRQLEAAVLRDTKQGPSVANPARDGPSDRVPGFFVPGVIENGETGCRAADSCPADTGAVAHTIAGHTASDVPLSASGPGAWQFTGVYENTDVLLKILRAAAGTYDTGPAATRK
jgi:alkaline phosphatase